MTERVNQRKFLVGEVVSAKMDKTRVVQVRWSAKHAQYLKTVRRAKKYKAHDEKNEAKCGDQVRIMETRPISKTKTWMITEIIRK